MASSVYNDEKAHPSGNVQNSSDNDSDTSSIITISDIDFDRYTITTEQDSSDTMSIATELPTYSSVAPQDIPVSEKQDHSPSPAGPCKNHTPSQTPAIDKHLQNPINRTYLLTLSEAIADLADDNHCTKCTADTVVRTLAAVTRDLKAAKQSGSMSKEKKKAMKREFKALGKGMKQDFKGMKQELKAVQKGLKDEERALRSIGV
ncbi:hypothetical protein CLAFUW4_10853 [Fulvia fulva]|uniref:Uncharacterized protein n=1 Tax=Passalora fulva TaxID=5499 RepID=A0A9Q8US37_PASFU|nr:uncharacterized protein CLAFUR5_09895 [Fulvia fulva]KAK4619794.1 hypothetical protein CLAFUR4_10858 [Fulvia fulva]KAK4620876.1 hypothetical protein CLAFUR0_10865 [Fulvia fulva]UJO20454.1 hypothetical protein CLAFUR5_09895 [Fulvia fulva]WPV17562.1 hypothetical protein CLAFUW4_10853 [Fulvia fulva]WPV31921.1 hypothetical protein CLAFUW7_10851 [Fulvia fulva]